MLSKLKILLWPKILITFLLAVILSVFIIKDFKEAKDRVSIYRSRSGFYKKYGRVLTKAKKDTLNSLMPKSFDYLLKFSAGEDVDAVEFKKYVLYYEKVTEYKPDQAEAYGMLGYCYYYLGKHDKAIQAYKKALYLKPSFFWFSYNLGVIYFKRGEYQEAFHSFKFATKIRPDFASKIITSSKIYMQLLKDVDDFKFLSFSLKKGYKNSLKILSLSQYHLKDFHGMLTTSAFAISKNLDESGDFYYYAGLALYNMKEYGRAVVSFQECIKRNKDNSGAIRHLGLSLHALGQKENALILLQQAKTLGSDNWEDALLSEKVELHIF